MLRQFVVGLSVLFVLAAGAAVVSAQNWENLGSREVKDRSEQDTWHLGKGKGSFRKIKIAVRERPVRFYRLEVKYENGQKQDIEVRSLIPAGGETRAIDLDGTDRYIDEINVWYEAATVRRGRRSTVVLWGMR